VVWPKAFRRTGDRDNPVTPHLQIRFSVHTRLLPTESSALLRNLREAQRGRKVHSRSTSKGRAERANRSIRRSGAYLHGVAPGVLCVQTRHSRPWVRIPISPAVTWFKPWLSSEILEIQSRNQRGWQHTPSASHLTALNLLNLLHSFAANN